MIDRYSMIAWEVKESSDKLKAIKAKLKTPIRKSDSLLVREPKPIFQALKSIEELLRRNLLLIDQIIRFDFKKPANEEILELIPPINRNLFDTKSALKEIAKYSNNSLINRFENCTKKLDKFFKENILGYLDFLDTLNYIQIDTNNAEFKNTTGELIKSLINFRSFIGSSKEWLRLESEESEQRSQFISFAAFLDKGESPSSQAYINELNKTFNFPSNLTVKKLDRKLKSADDKRFNDFIQTLGNQLLKPKYRSREMQSVFNLITAKAETLKRPIELILILIKLREAAQNPEFRFDFKHCIRSMDLAEADLASKRDKKFNLLDKILRFSQSASVAKLQSIHKKCQNQLGAKPELKGLVTALRNCRNIKRNFNDRQRISLDYIFDEYKLLLQQVYPEPENIDYKKSADRTNLARNEFKKAMLQIMKANKEPDSGPLMRLFTATKSKAMKINSIPANQVEEFVVLLCASFFLTDLDLNK